MSLGPTEHSRFATRFGIQGRTFDSGSFPVAQIRWATPDYFRVLGIPLRRGRWLTDSEADQNRILINETLARRFFANQNPVGQHLILGVMDPKQKFQRNRRRGGRRARVGAGSRSGTDVLHHFHWAGDDSVDQERKPIRMQFAPAVRDSAFKPSIRKFRFRRSNLSLRMWPTRWLGVVSRSRCSESSEPWPHCSPPRAYMACWRIR